MCKIFRGEYMKHSVYKFWSFLEKSCTLDTDSPEERRSKVTLVVITGLCSIASVIWGTLYYAIFGPIITTFITYGFTVVLGAALLIYFKTKRFAFLLYVFFLMIFWNEYHRSFNNNYLFDDVLC
jgi:hypothetical protein